MGVDQAGGHVLAGAVDHHRVAAGGETAAHGSDLPVAHEHVGVLEDTVVVPRSAVRGEGDERFVVVTSAEGSERRPVKLGLGDLVRVSVEEGLEGNERIVLGADPTDGGPLATPDEDEAADSAETASTAAFGGPARHFGEGGSIPFMAMLGERYPDAQFVITGVLLPDSNAHGPNEYLHLPTARRLTHAVAHLLGAHATRS